MPPRRAALEREGGQAPAPASKKFKKAPADSNYTEHIHNGLKCRYTMESCGGIYRWQCKKLIPIHKLHHPDGKVTTLRGTGSCEPCKEKDKARSASQRVERRQSSEGGNATSGSNQPPHQKPSTPVSSSIPADVKRPLPTSFKPYSIVPPPETPSTIGSSPQPDANRKRRQRASAIPPNPSFPTSLPSVANINQLSQATAGGGLFNNNIKGGIAASTYPDGAVVLDTQPQVLPATAFNFVHDQQQIFPSVLKKDGDENVEAEAAQVLAFLATSTKRASISSSNTP